MALHSEGKAGCTSATFPLCLRIDGFRYEETLPWNGRIIGSLLSLRICNREMYVKYGELASAFWISQPTSQSKHFITSFQNVVGM